MNIKVAEDEGKRFADLNNLKFLSISLKNNINITNFINSLKSDIENNVKNDINNGINEIFYGNPSKNSYKIAFVGQTGIGVKNSLISRIIFNYFDYTVERNGGASYSPKVFQLKNGEQLEVELWDIAGGEKYKKLVYFI